MRKMLILVGMLLVSFTLVACTDDTPVVTPPTFISMTVDGIAPVSDGELITFYKGKTEAINIEVNINNPDGLVITSVIIDGYNYFASRFADSSTASKIVFEMSAGSVLGPKTLSLDEITYKDGNNTKSVLVSTNNIFNKYVFKNTPTVERESYSVNQETITVNFDILDLDSVITTDSLIAELYSGETLIDYEFIAPGQTLVTFSDLLSNKNYEIKVKANFDLDDNTGFKSDVVLYSGEFSTLNNSIPNASLSNITVTSNSIVFDVTYVDNDSVTKVNGITVGIFKDDVLDSTIPLVTLTGSTEEVIISNLLNNNDYTLKVLSDYDLLDGHATITDAVIASYTFSTLARPVPTVDIENLNVEENRILFSFDIVDPDGLIDKETLIAKLYIDDVLQEEVAINEYSADFQIFNLFADDTFVIEIEASYDLNDGVGTQTDKIIFSQEFTTYVNDTPAVFVEDIIITQGYVTVGVEVSDEDFTLKGALTAILYEVSIVAEVETEVEVGRIQFNEDDSELVFSYLTSHLKGYRVDIVANFDLRDGTVPKTDANIFISVLLSSGRKAPAAELNDIDFDSEEITLDINIMDSDDTIEAGTTYVYLFFEGVAIRTEALVVGNNAVVFTGLSSNNEYEIIVETDYNYDLLEESVLLLKQELNSNVVYTLEKDAPSANISPADVITGVGDIDIKVEVIDNFGTIDILTLVAVLYLDDADTGLSETLIVGNNFNVKFAGLLSDKQYEVRIMTEYNLNDGNGSTALVELTSYVIKTNTKEIPSSDNFNIEGTQDEITFDIEIIDADGAITGVPVAKLFIGSVDTGIEIDLIVGINSSIKFTPVFSNERYNIRIVADYDFNNGTPESIQLESVIASDYINTLTNEMVTAELTDLVSDKTSLTFNVDVVDDDGVIDSDLQAVLYDELGVAVAAITPKDLVVGENLNVTFTGLFSNTNYIVKIETNYNLNEGDGVEAAVLDDGEEGTLMLDGPSASITIDSAETKNTRIEFDVLVTDTDLTIDILTLKAYLYDSEGLVVGTPIDLVVGDNDDLFFDALMFGTDYEIRVVSNYNLNDDGPDVVGEVLEDAIESTVSLISIYDIYEDKKLVNFALDLTDVFGVLIPVDEVTGVEVQLFDENGLPVGDVYFMTEPTDFDLLNLWSDYDYTIVVKGDYDIGAGTVNDTVFEYSFHTLPVDIPDISILVDSLDLSNATDITFEVTGIGDPDGIISGFVDDTVTPGTLEAALFKRVGGVWVQQAVLPLPENNTYTFLGYDGTDGEDYSIVIRAVVDLNDSEGPTTDYEFFVKSWIWAIKN